MLEKDEIAWAMKNIASLPPGRYTMKHIFGVHWEGNRRPRDYGKWFKAWVLHDDLPGVRLIGRKSNRSLLYEVSVAFRRSFSEAITETPIPSRTIKEATTQVV